MKIAFCTSCMQRKWQIEQTLAHNLEVVRPRGHVIALVDYNSRDGLEEYVKQKFLPDIQQGSLLFFRTDEPTSFHMSIAKNVAHRLGLQSSPDVLFNLDADNYVTPQTIEALTKLFSDQPRSVFHNWSWDGQDGTAGRIALSAADWVLLGGYDESLLPMTVQDIDLLFRARVLGLRYVLNQEIPRPPVANDFNQKVANLQPLSPQEDRGDKLFSNLPNLRLMMGDNIGRALNRPVLLKHSEQRRFKGSLNFGPELTL